MSTCTLIQSTTNETYAPTPFENTGNIKFYHNNVPRLENTNDVLNLVQGTPNQQQEYFQGLLTTPILLAIFVMTWIFALWVNDRFAGKPVPLPEEPNTENHDDDVEEVGLEKSSSGEPTVEVSVFKEKQGSRTGLKLGQNRNGDLIALRLDEKGLFYEELQLGQRIVSIHGNPPEDNDKVFLQQMLKDGAQDFVHAVKRKTTGNSDIEYNKADECANKAAEGMKTLKDSVGTVTLVVKGTLHKQDSKYAKWKNENDRVLRQKTVFKSIVAFSLFVLCFTGIVLLSAGVNGLESAIDSGVETLDVVEGKMRQGVEFLDDALRVSQLINSNVNSLLVSLNGICPDQTSQICSNLNDLSSCQNLNGLSIGSQMQQVISYLQDDATHEQLIQDALTALDDIATQTADADTNLDPVNQALAGALAFGIIVILISIFLLMVLFMPMPGVVKSTLFCLSYGFIFVIVLFSFIVLLAVIPASSAVGDLCYNDPGSRIETILRDNMDTSSSDQIEDFVFNIFRGCSAPDARFDENINFQTEGIGVFGGFDAAIAQVKQNAAICGTSSSAIANVETTLNGVTANLCEASNILTEFSDFFTCRFWHPIYAQAAHEALCYQGMDALSAITNTLFVILCMSLLILTFRVALWDAALREASEDKKKEVHNKTLKAESKKRGEDFDSAENMIPKQKSKKKEKRKSKHRPQEAGMENEDTAHESHEWNAEGLEAHEEGEVPAGVDGRRRKKKGRKKKKKKKRPSHQDGEGEVNDEAAEPEATYRAVDGETETLKAEGAAVDPDYPSKKKKRKKKKNKNKEDGAYRRS